MSDLDEFRATYFEECAELLNELEEQFAAISEGDRHSERLHAIFRAVHSIKGGGGAFGFAGLVNFTHAYETLLDHVRDGRIGLTPPVIALCLKANDIVADFVRAARTGGTLPADYGFAEKEQFDTLTEGGALGEPVTEFDLDFVPVMVDLDSELDTFGDSPLGMTTGHWEIRFRPHPELYSRANDPLLLFRELATLGEIEVRALLDELPPLAEFEPFGVYCAWEISLSSASAGLADIAEVFEFVDGNCDLSIVQLSAIAPMAAETEPDTGTDAIPSFEELAAELKVATPTRAVEPEPESEPASPIVAEMPKPVLVATDSEEDRRVGEADRRNTGIQSIRVDLDKVDRVVNMVGELVITQSMLATQMDESLRARYQELVRGLEVLSQTTRGLQDAVMAIRAQPVKSVFSRMPRLVRELMQKTGKKLKLEMVGEATEIDKTMIEQLADPLTHMIRNSADHGIESPERRLAAGKPEFGTIRISAEQSGGNILVVVEDDGAGINREKVLAVAQKKHVVDPDQVLSDEQIDQLIFAPGFSTAETISDISGRGVGMDVVLANIKKIGGSVHVRSWTGKGARITLRLPLTLAVLDVMLVKVAGNPYVIPLSSIVETIQCGRADFGRQPSGAQVLRVRGDYVQVVDLAERFMMPTSVDPARRFVVLCEADGNTRIGLVVDDVLGQQQVVIKSLEENFERIDGIAGGTILGDGNVALIVDPQGLRTVVHRRAA